MHRVLIVALHGKRRDGRVVVGHRIRLRRRSRSGARRCLPTTAAALLTLSFTATALATLGRRATRFRLLCCLCRVGLALLAEPIDAARLRRRAPFDVAVPI